MNDGPGDSIVKVLQNGIARDTESFQTLLLRRCQHHTTLDRAFLFGGESECVAVGLPPHIRCLLLYPPRLLPKPLRTPMLRFERWTSCKKQWRRSKPVSRAIFASIKTALSQCSSEVHPSKTGKVQLARDYFESKLTMPVLQAVLEVINRPDLRNTNWKNLSTSRATRFRNYDVFVHGQSQSADDVVESKLTMPVSRSFRGDKPTRSEKYQLEKPFHLEGNQLQ